jgi:hypothetical protein
MEEGVDFLYYCQTTILDLGNFLTLEVKINQGRKYPQSRHIHEVKLFWNYHRRRQKPHTHIY